MSFHKKSTGRHTTSENHFEPGNGPLLRLVMAEMSDCKSITIRAQFRGLQCHTAPLKKRQNSEGSVEGTVGRITTSNSLSAD